MESLVDFQKYFKFQHPTSTLHVKPFLGGRKKTIQQKQLDKTTPTTKIQVLFEHHHMIGCGQVHLFGSRGSTRSGMIWQYGGLSPSNLWRKLVSRLMDGYPQDLWNDMISSYENLYCFSSWWLNQPTHLKNDDHQNGIIFPKFRGEH